jgi:predicted nucleic acid-binding protein
MPIERHEHEWLLSRIWQLRNHFSAYDAAYVTLAEILQAPLITRDSRLARATGSRAAIELI